MGENPSDAEVQDLMIEVDPWSFIDNIIMLLL